MGRKLSVDYSAFNIRVHPHPDKSVYVDLFETLFKQNKKINIGNNTSAKINRLWAIHEDNPLEGFIGEIIKYNDITEDGWVNIETGKSAEQDELDAIQIPDDLKPNGKTFYFVFFPKTHILITEIRDKNGAFSPKMQEKFFKLLFTSKTLLEKFNAIDITIFPDTSAVKHILESKTLKKLELIIQRPNPNDFEVFEEDILAEMESQKAKVFEKKLIAQDKQYLAPNEITKKQIQVAADNGKIIYTDVDPETGLLNRDRSTSETPFIERDKYDPAKTTALDFIKIKATEIVQTLKSRM